MSTQHVMKFEVDQLQKKIHVERDFEAPLPMVWQAWTDAEILDQWWAPKPWKCVTRRMDFRPGGVWHYAMVGPKGERQWCLAHYETVEEQERYTLTDAFCDDKENISTDKPRAHWDVRFASKGEGTRVLIDVLFDNQEDVSTIIEMGFREGFIMGMENLDHYISTHYRLRKESKTSRKVRAASYLNFPGKTEEAFLFYKKVFNGEFTGVGLRRFGDIEMPEGHPEMSEADKKLIIHAELTIMGGHVLMATDAPESMGFKLEQGNNMHINLEPGSREETERLFRELSEGGEVSMPLSDMFWGAYFASFRDKYGINWMLHYQDMPQ